MFAVAAVMAVAEDHRLHRNDGNHELRLERKYLRDTSDPFRLDPEYFRRSYRLLPHLVLHLVDRLHDALVPGNSGGVPPYLQVLCALRFFAGGNYQWGVGEECQHPLGQTMVSRIIERVANALGEIADDVIQFPNTIEDRQRTQEEFRRHIRIPGILGLIDCFLVALRRPSENEEAFYNYKGYHGLNVQVIRSHIDILDIAYSNNDRHVWQYSDMKEHMEALRGDTQIRREEGRYYFIGDSGYTPSPVFLTPIRNAVEGTPQAEYTREIVQTRCRVEQLFGTFTAVWRSIKRERRMLYKPEKAAKIIIACATLYNFRLLNGIVDDIPQRRVPINEIGENMNYVAGIREREYIINTYYRG